MIDTNIYIKFYDNKYKRYVGKMYKDINISFILTDMNKHNDIYNIILYYYNYICQEFSTYPIFIEFDIDTGKFHIGGTYNRNTDILIYVFSKKPVLEESIRFKNAFLFW